MDIGSLASSTGTPPSAATQAGTRLGKDFGSFLTLLTTQLQQQDPLNPLDSKEFTQQLVQFTGVEQAIATNKNLENIIASIAAQSTNGLVGYLGKDITAAGDRSTLTDGRAIWNYELGASADKTDITITDKTGKVVFKTDGATAAGNHVFTWDGRDNLGNALPDGVYKIAVSAVSANDTRIEALTSIQGRVTSVETGDGKRTLVVDGLKVPLENVTKISEPAPQNSQG